MQSLQMQQLQNNSMSNGLMQQLQTQSIDVPIAQALLM